MDRFIEAIIASHYKTIRDLKSNMDRFIEIEEKNSVSRLGL